MSLNAFWSDPTDGTSFLSSHVFQSFSGGYGYTLAHQHVLRKFVQHVFLSIFSHSQSPFLGKVHTRRCRNLSRPCTNWKHTRPIADSAGLGGKSPQHHSGWKEKHHFHLYDLEWTISNLYVLYIYIYIIHIIHIMNCKKSIHFHSQSNRCFHHAGHLSPDSDLTNPIDLARGSKRAPTSQPSSPRDVPLQLLEVSPWLKVHCTASFYLPAYVPPYLSIYLFIYLSNLSIYLSVCLSVFLPDCLAVCLSLCLSTSLSLSIYLSI